MATIQQDPLIAGLGTAQTPEQMAAASKGAITGAGSLDPTINSSNLSSTTQITPVQPVTTPTYPVASLGSTNTTGSATPSLQLTPQEQKQSEIASQLASLNTQESGKSAFQADKYKTLGFGMTYDAQGNIVPDAGTADLSAKLTSLTSEAQAIPLQLQQDATGRGITTGGLQPIQTGALRNNAIQALGVSALIAAKNGQLATAQHYVDNATIQKFGPIEAQIKALQANLELVKNDPQTSLQDKNRAQAQLDIQNKKAADVAQQKADYTAAQAEVLKYASVANASVLSQMQKATTAVEVAQIAAANGIQAPGTNKSQIIGSADTGYTNVVTDANGKVISSTPVTGGTGTGTKSTKPFTATEIQQYQVDYPDAGIKIGDSPASIQAKINPAANYTGAVFNGLSATLPDGGTLTFPTQAAADKFKKDNGIANNSQSTPPASAPTSPLETKIASLKKSGILTNADIRASLLKQGHTQAEINASSVGSLKDKALSVVGSLFGGLGFK